MYRSLALAAALAMTSVAALAAGPVHSPGSAAPAAKSTPLHCDENATDAKDSTHRHCDCDPKKSGGHVPADLSDMIEEHFLSVQAEPATAAL